MLNRAELERRLRQNRAEPKEIELRMQAWCDATAMRRRAGEIDVRALPTRTAATVLTSVAIERIVKY